jgi:hypothetical protein
MENDILGKPNPKIRTRAILTSEKADVRLKLVRRDKEGHNLLIKEIIHKEGITMVNVSSPNVDAPNFIKQTLLDIIRLIGLDKIMMTDFNTPFSMMNRLSRTPNPCPKK